MFHGYKCGRTQPFFINLVLLSDLCLLFISLHSKKILLRRLPFWSRRFGASITRLILIREKTNRWPDFAFRTIFRTTLKKSFAIAGTFVRFRALTTIGKTYDVSDSRRIRFYAPRFIRMHIQTTASFIRACANIE
jgi:hypothetical protein